MRNTFIHELEKAAEIDSKIFLLVGDLGFSVVENFQTKFPDRFLNVGIAEQNMIGIAAGLSMEGFNVYVYSIGNFATLRCLEQIRYDVCYHRQNVKVVAVGAGFAYGSLGASHHATEDLAIMRSLPHMLVAAPGDTRETKAITHLTTQHQGPAYIRLGRAGEADVHGRDIQVTPGELIQVRAGKKTLILTSGGILSWAMREADEKTPDAAIYSVPFLSGNLNKKQLTQLLTDFDQVITMEEHQLNGGFGSFILEQAADLYSSGALSRFPKIRRIGIPNEFAEICGTQDYLRDHFALRLP
ncbi:MAG: hypothetical protein KF681_13100 [Bdellovibrionaceae bacterium]|nr:hypothetical protein [Pseudobdellovibrionaceae bacterium]